MDPEYQIAIIGGGIGGLTVGTYLAQHGLRTMIFEAHDHAGGYVTSFHRDGFTFDAGVTSFGSNGIVFPILAELGLGELAFRRVKRQLVTENWQARVDGSFEPIRRALEKVYPAEQEQIESFFQWLEMASNGFKRLFSTHLFLEGWREVLVDLVRLPWQNWEFTKFLVAGQQLTNRELHRKYFQNPELIDFLDQIGYPTMSGLITAGMWHSFKEDYWYPVGGMGKFRDRLIERYLQAGGEISYQTKVKKLVFNREGRRPIIQLADGREVEVGHVISNVNPKDTYLNLIGEEWIESRLADKLQTGQPSESVCSLYLGLEGKGFKSSPYSLQASHSTFYLQDEQGQPQNFALYILTNEEPELAPEGEVVILHCFDELGDWEHFLTQQQPWTSSQEQRPTSQIYHNQTYQTNAYYQKKGVKLETLLQLARQVIPDLDRRLVVQELATPLTLRRYTGNPGGATAGWSWNPTQQLHVNWLTEGKISGLDLVGGWLLHPGGIPTTMLTARWVAQRVCKDFTVFKQ